VFNPPPFLNLTRTDVLLSFFLIFSILSQSFYSYFIVLFVTFFVGLFVVFITKKWIKAAVVPKLSISSGSKCCNVRCEREMRSKTLLKSVTLIIPCHSILEQFRLMWNLASLIKYPNDVCNITSEYIHSAQVHVSSKDRYPNPHNFIGILLVFTLDVIIHERQGLDRNLLLTVLSPYSRDALILNCTFESESSRHPDKNAPLRRSAIFQYLFFLSFLFLEFLVISYVYS